MAAEDIDKGEGGKELIDSDAFPELHEAVQEFVVATVSATYAKLVARKQSPGVWHVGFGRDAEDGEPDFARIEGIDSREYFNIENSDDSVGISLPPPLSETAGQMLTYLMLTEWNEISEYREPSKLEIIYNRIIGGNKSDISSFIFVDPEPEEDPRTKAIQHKSPNGVVVQIKQIQGEQLENDGPIEICYFAEDTELPPFAEAAPLTVVDADGTPHKHHHFKFRPSGEFGDDWLFFSESRDEWLPLDSESSEKVWAMAFPGVKDRDALVAG